MARSSQASVCEQPSGGSPQDGGRRRRETTDAGGRKPGRGSLGIVERASTADESSRLVSPVKRRERTGRPQQPQG